MKNIVYADDCKSSKIIAEVPSFGAQYTWRMMPAEKSNNKLTGSELHHFSTLIIPAVDTNVTRLRVLKNAEQYKDAYVFLDGSGALYDMKGKPVWYFQGVEGFTNDKAPLRDLKITPQGTITFLYEELCAYEINYDGKVLWKTPHNGKVSGRNGEYIHHEFTKLQNGHYMILGCEYELWNQQLPSADSSYLIHHDDRTKPINDPVIEYDEKGNVVWSWKSSEYFRHSDVYYHTMHGRKVIAPHENSFYFDEKDSIIYIGFRNISRVLKVKYPEGNVLRSYGEAYGPEADQKGKGLFCGQHSVRLSDEGYLYLFDNNNCESGAGLPSILKLEEPHTAGKPLKKIWQYECTTEGGSPDQAVGYQFPVGGNVIELPDHSLFANMSTTYSKVFILSKDKKILWSAVPEKWNTENKNWKMIYEYRASIITSRNELEQLIWKSEGRE